jgi:hypothetical protein
VVTLWLVQSGRRRQEQSNPSRLFQLALHEQRGREGPVAGLRWSPPDSKKPEMEHPQKPQNSARGAELCATKQQMQILRCAQDDN